MNFTNLRVKTKPMPGFAFVAAIVLRLPALSLRSPGLVAAFRTAELHAVAFA